MKTLILSTIAAAALALSAGTALASSNSSDNGFEIYRQSQSQAHNAPTTNRQFLSGWGDNGANSYDDQDTAGHGSPQASSSPGGRHN